MDHFVSLGKMTCERGIYDTNVGRVIAPVYCTDYTSDARLFIESLGDCYPDRDSCQPRMDFDCCLFGQDVTRVATHTANFGR